MFGAEFSKRFSWPLFAWPLLVSSAWTAGLAHAGPMLSDGTDGAFAPSSSVTLTPDADGVFNFTDIRIPDDVLVSFDYDAFDGPLYMLATGDVLIDGALDAGQGPFHLHARGTITNRGKVYGEPFEVRAGDGFHWEDNPNGNPDIHVEGQVTRTITPDGPLPVAQDEVEQTDATVLSGGVVMTLAFATLPVFVISTDMVGGLGVIDVAPIIGIPSLDIVPPPQPELLTYTPTPDSENDAAAPLPSSLLLLLAGLPLLLSRPRMAAAA